MSDYLIHYGVKGMKWGVRRYQNYDGTAIGNAAERYSDAKKEYRQKNKDFKKAFNTYYNKSASAYSPIKKHRENNMKRLENAVDATQLSNVAKANVNIKKNEYKMAKSKGDPYNIEKYKYKRDLARINKKYLEKGENVWAGRGERKERKQQYKDYKRKLGDINAEAGNIEDDKYEKLNAKAQKEADKYLSTKQQRDAYVSNQSDMHFRKAEIYTDEVLRKKYGNYTMDAANKYNSIQTRRFIAGVMAVGGAYTIYKLRQ